MSAPASESLDPCPWCDTTTHLLFVEASTDESYEKGRILARVVCNNPTHNGLIAGPAAFTSQPYVSWGTPVSEAIAAWNARAILSRLTASEARNGELSGELEKIAEMCGEADDPFSAWETIELWRDNLQASEARVKALEGALADSEESLAIVRQSLVEQAEARLDPTMPLLTLKVLEDLRGDAEAAYAMAETREERVAAHGLSLLCDWQDKARALLSPTMTSKGLTKAQRELLEDKFVLWERESRQDPMDLRDYNRRAAEALKVALSIVSESAHEVGE